MSSQPDPRSTVLTPKAFIERAMEHLPALLRVGNRLARSHSDAEDLVQDTLVRAMERRAELRDPEHLKGWLLAVQRTVHLNGHRGLRHRLEVLDGGLAAASRPPTGDLAHELERGPDDALLAALDALSPEWREALWLREVEELSYEEIARVQGCPIGTVRSRLARAREAVLEQLSNHEVSNVRLQR